MDYLVHILTLICIYAVLAVSLNLIAGCTGLLSVAHAALFGVGAYIAALAAVHLHVGFAVAVICAVAGAGIISLIVALPSLRVHDDYFVLATFCFQVVFFHVTNNWIGLTGGPMGIPGIPEPKVLGVVLSSNTGFLTLALGLALLTYALACRLASSPFGRVLKAIREDEIFAQALGKNITAFKLQVFVIGGILAAAAGTLYAYYVTFIDPTSFTVQESILILAMVIVGGSGSVAGSVVGAFVLVSLPEVLRFLGLPSSIAANIRQITYGGLLVLCMLFRPQGIMGEFTLRKVGHSR